MYLAQFDFDHDFFVVFQNVISSRGQSNFALKVYFSKT